MADAAKVLEDALALAPAQRSRIARELIESLEGDAGAEDERKVEAIRAALAEGEQSGIAEDSSLEGVLAEFRSSRPLSDGWLPPTTASALRRARNRCLHGRPLG
jgi:hypothetical protein